jgi:GNAT superfamily N-acetyltransferase
MTEPTFRQATIHDADAVSEIIASVVAEANPVGFDGPMSGNDVRTWLTRLGGEGGLFLCSLEGRIVGFSAVDFDTHQADTAVIGSWILPQYRRQGLGTALAEYALGFARDKGYKRIRGRLPQGNQPALSFLSSIGALVPMTNPDAVFELPLYEETTET